MLADLLLQLVIGDIVDDWRNSFAILEGLLLREQVEDEMSEPDYNELIQSINILVLLKPIEPYQGCALYV